MWGPPRLRHPEILDTQRREAYAECIGTLSTERRRNNFLSRLWRFWLRRRTERDQQYVAVLSDQCGAKDVHDAKLAREVNAGRQAKEAPRGLNG